MIAFIAFCSAFGAAPHQLEYADPWSSPRIPAAGALGQTREVRTSVLEPMRHDQPLDGVAVRITNPEKLIADALKYRNKIGQDIALEALKE